MGSQPFFQLQLCFCILGSGNRLYKIPTPWKLGQLQPQSVFLTLISHIQGTYVEAFHWCFEKLPVHDRRTHKYNHRLAFRCSTRHGKAIIWGLFLSDELSSQKLLVIADTCDVFNNLAALSYSIFKYYHLTIHFAKFPSLHGVWSLQTIYPHSGHLDSWFKNRTLVSTRIKPGLIEIVTFRINFKFGPRNCLLLIKPVNST